MPTIVGQHGVAAFTSPSNGDPLDATVVRANDNTMRSAYVTHDSDTGIHLQSSVLSTRPTAGTAGRKWMTSDSGSVKIFYDNGANWEEVAYLPTTGDATLLGNFNVNGNVVLGDASGDTVAVTGTVSSSLTPTATNSYDLGATGSRWRNGWLSGTLTAAGNTSLGGTLTVTGTSLFNSSVTVSGTVVATTFSGSGASLTSIPATAITPGQFGGTTGQAYTINGSLTVNTGVSLSGGATITGNALFTGGTVRSNRTTVASFTGNGNVSYTNGNHVRVTLTGNSTITPTGGLAGGVYTLEVVQDGVGGRTLAFGSSVLWSNGAQPGYTTTAARKDIYTFFFDGTYYIGTQFAINVASTV